MTEDEAKAWVSDRFGDAAIDVLDRIGTLVARESERQNLVAHSTLAQMWTRHLADSAQLVALAGDGDSWTDIGTGAGFPGLVAAALFDGAVTLVEPRARRVAFLRHAAEQTGLAVRIEQCRAEALPAGTSTFISARAVASTDTLLAISAHLRDATTRYLLPRGQAGRSELDFVRHRWHGTFHVEQSITDPASVIITATGVAARCSVSP